jgi:acetate kinase
MRRRVCLRLKLLGLRLEDERNESADGRAPTRISTDDSAPQAWVIPTDEERQIARDAYAVLQQH